MVKKISNSVNSLKNFVFLYLKHWGMSLVQNLMYLIKYGAYSAVTKCDKGPVLVSV